MARRRVDLARINFVLFTEYDQQFLRCGSRIVHLAEVFETYDELVAAPSARIVADAQVILQASCDFLQHRVANVMTQRVIDRPEPIEIDKQDGERHVLALAATDCT